MAELRRPERRQSNSPFLDLPLELRNKIYSAYFGGEKRLFVRGWLTGTRGHRSVPPLLLLNKQIRDEALAVRQKQTTVEIYCDFQTAWNLHHETFIGYAAKKRAQAEPMFTSLSGYRNIRLTATVPWHCRDGGGLKWRTAITRLLTSLSPGGDLTARSSSSSKALNVRLFWPNCEMSSYMNEASSRYASFFWIFCRNDPVLASASFEINANPPGEFSWKPKGPFSQAELTHYFRVWVAEDRARLTQSQREEWLLPPQERPIEVLCVTKPEDGQAQKIQIWDARSFITG